MRDERGFEEFVEARLPGLFRHAHQLSGDPVRSTDLVEQGLVAAHRRWRELDPDGADELARRTILTALLRRHGRSRGPARPPRPVGPAGSDGPARPDGGDGTEVVWRALAGLPVRRRAVLVLRYADGLTDAAIADRLGARPEAAAAEAAIGLAALGRILRGRGRPEDLLPAALAGPPAANPAVGSAAGSAGPATVGATQVGAGESGGGQSGAGESGGHSGGRGSGGGRFGGRGVSAGDVFARVRRERRHRRAVRAGWAAAVVVVAVGAVAVPATVGAGKDGTVEPAPAVAAAADAARRGLLDWPARGSLTGDQQLLRSALASWQADAPAAERPQDAISVLYAGEVGGARLVLLQALDPAGQARVAEVTAGAGGPRLTRTDPLLARIPVLAVPAAAADPAAGSTGPTPSAPGSAAPPAAGSPARLRLLGPPAEGRALYVRDGSGQPAAPLRRLERDGTGLSEPFAAAGPTYVVVLDPADPGTPAAAGTGSAAGPDGDSTDPPAGAAGTATGLRGGSGVLNTGRLAAVPDMLEYGTPTLPVTGPTAPSYGWFADGRLIAQRLHRPARVALLGPSFRWQVKSGPARGHEFRSQSYEVTSGGQRLLSVIVRLDGKVLCADLTRLSAAAAVPAVPLVANRCLAPRYGAGIVTVLAAPRTSAITLTLAAARPGQRAYRHPFRIPAGAPASAGYVGAGLIAGNFPTGAGRADATSNRNTRAGRALLAPYRR